MRDGLEQRIHWWQRNRRFLYRWSSDWSDSGGGRKSGKRALASHDPIAEENHRHVAHVALKEEGKGEENKEENELSIDVLLYCVLSSEETKPGTFCGYVDAIFISVSFRFASFRIAEGRSTIRQHRIK